MWVDFSESEKEKKILFVSPPATFPARQGTKVAMWATLY